MHANLVIDARAEIGEGSIWDHRTQQLYWIDVLKGEIHRYSPESKSDEVFSVGQSIGTVVPCLSEGLIIALQDGIYHFNTETKEIKLVADTERTFTGNRFNDGKCDTRGRFWVGSTSLTCDVPAAGSLYRMNKDFTIRKVLSDLTISNGIVWTEDEGTMYFIDSPTNEVWGFDYNPDTGAIDHQRTAVAIPLEDGMPDGMSIDAQGMIWVALFGGGKICRYNPNNGKKLSEIQIPASQITSCAFGGEKLDQLFITSARTGLNRHELSKEPLAGGLFVAEPGVVGVRTSLFQGL